MSVEDEGGPNAVVKVKDGAVGRWAALQKRYVWLRHVVDAFGLLTRNNGNQYAAAITYFSFLALFPLLLLAASVTGYVLYNQPDLQRSLFSHITDAIPGTFGVQIKTAIQKTISHRGSVGLIGLVGVLLTGLGWIGNLRQALDAVWGRKPPKKNFVMSRVSNLLVLFGLGAGIVVSLALTVVGTSLTNQIVNTLGLDSLPGSTILLKVVGIAIAALADIVIFWWVLVKIPEQTVERSVAFKGALMASVGFEILKIVGTYTIAHASQSKTAGPFGPILAVLIWIQLVARFQLFCCAWIATVTAEGRTANSIPVIEPPAMAAHPAVDAPSVNPATVGATLVGAGAVAGAVGFWAATRPKAK
ncbi:YhjD/YihY/BrkB family envelope integrity protein [uncultured Jatrophihabitans sp.]|uniref:YhjD/YihY/BrkB family envelope integrity protein n=1 Tax=uncultured Jatrophihabitans sp. TaxID=1610747 RepID=UPI0035C9F4AA